MRPYLYAECPGLLDSGRVVSAEQHGGGRLAEGLQAQDGQILVVDDLVVGGLGQLELGLLYHGENPRLALVRAVRAHAQAHLDYLGRKNGKLVHSEWR